MSVLWPRVTSLQNLNFVWYPILVLHFVVTWYDIVNSYYGQDFGPALSFSAFHRPVMMVLECRLCLSLFPPLTNFVSHSLGISSSRSREADRIAIWLRPGPDWSLWSRLLDQVPRGQSQRRQRLGRIQALRSWNPRFEDGPMTRKLMDVPLQRMPLMRNKCFRLTSSNAFLLSYRQSVEAPRRAWDYWSRRWRRGDSAVYGY